jgi:hypothetical protein
MRTFGDKEKEILKLLKDSNGLKFQSLFLEKVIDQKIKINYEENTVEVSYKTEGFSPTNEEQQRIIKQSNELFRRIYLCVTLVNYFEKEGLIGLFSNQERDNEIVIGGAEISEIGVFNEIQDETIKKLLLEYTDKILIITEAFREFVNNGFISKDEKRQRSSLKVAWIGVATAIVIGLGSFVISIFKQPDKVIENQVILNRKIDSLERTNSNIEKKLEGIKSDANEEKKDNNASR